MEPSVEMSLAQKIAAAKEASKTKVFEEDRLKRETKAQAKEKRATERREAAERRKQEREKKIEAIKNKIESIKDKAKQEKETRRIKSLERKADRQAAPEVRKLIAKDRSERLNRWVEARGVEIKNGVESTCNKIVNSVENRIDKIGKGIEYTRNDIVQTYTEMGQGVKAEVVKGKNSVVEVWRRQAANAASERTLRAYNKAEKLQQIADKQREKFRESSVKTGEIVKTYVAINEMLHPEKYAPKPTTV